MTTRARSRTTAAVVLVASLALVGCGSRDDVPHGASSGGQTRGQAASALERLPGLTIELDGGGAPNVKGSTGYDVAVGVAPGYRIVDGPALVTYLTETAWSVRDGYQPNTQVAITVDTGDGERFDVRAAAVEAGWPQPRDTAPGSSDFTVALVDVRDGSPARERLGDWPGDVPAVPSDVTARR
jgi:hypothetical protein